jgi:hypothetical protein
MAVNLAVAADRLGQAAAVIDIDHPDLSDAPWLPPKSSVAGVQQYEPDGKAAREIEALFTHIQTELKENDNVQENQAGRRSAA